MNPELEQLEQEQSKRLTRVLYGTTWRRFFFSPALAYCRISTGWHIPTAAVHKSGRMWFNPAYLAQISDEELEGIICHEVSHLLYRHDERRGNRDHFRWNVAGDRAINAILREAGISLPKGCLYPLLPEHEMLCAEDLYDLEPEQQEGYEGGGGGGEGDGDGEGGDGKKGPRPGEGCGLAPGDGKDDGEGSDGDGGGDGEGGDGEGGDDDGERFVGDDNGPDWGAIAVQCAASASQGDGSGEALRRLSSPPPSYVRWDQVLRHALNRSALAHGRDDVTFTRRSRRTQIGGMIFPGGCSYKAKVAVTIDTSGSMGEDAISAAIATCRAIGQQLHVGVFVVGHTSRAYYADWVGPGTTADQLANRLNESGGTSFKDAFDKVEDTHARFDYLVQLTDGECRWPDWPVNCHRKIVALVGMRCKDYLPSDAEIIETEL